MLKKLSRAQIIALSFICIIFIGSLLLLLPFAARAGEKTSFIDALFVATSATCVTGLIPFDTFTHWTLFGQLVILALIQVGGIGFMTVITMVTIFLHHRVGLKNRMLIMESAGTVSLSGVNELVRNIIIGTAAVELAGAAVLATRFIPTLGAAKGIYASVFHSVSAFCNAGFDVMGMVAPDSSLSLYRGDVVVNLAVCMLIIIGGAGFFVWNDVIACKGRFKNYQLHTKLVLVSTGLLIIIPWALFFLFEYNGAFKDMDFGEKALAALFQAVTPRTAGFATVNMAELSEPGGLLTIFLMFIGGSPGSTAGGIKTTTAAAIFLSTVAYLQQDSNVTVFKRRIEEKLVRRACAIAVIYFGFVFVSAMLISALEPLSLREVLFETVSAVATVGLSMSVTPGLSAVSKMILIILMYAGRLGALTFIMMLYKKDGNAIITRPAGKILIG